MIYYDQDDIEVYEKKSDKKRFRCNIGVVNAIYTK